MAYQGGVRPVRYGNPTEVITAARLAAAYTKWTTTAHGKLEAVYSVIVHSLTTHRVGGIVSETAFKFFIQFCFYTLLYCIFVLVVMAYFFAQRHSEV